jgi:hypothetical protein
LNCQGIQQSLLSMAAQEGCTASMLFASAEGLIRDGTALDAATAPSKVLDLNVLEHALLKQNQDLKKELRSFKREMIAEQEEVMNSINDARDGGGRSDSCAHCKKNRPRTAHTHSTAECKTPNGFKSTFKNRGGNKRAREKYCDFHETTSHSNEECNAQRNRNGRTHQKKRTGPAGRGDGKRDTRDVTCFNCNEKGHYANACPQKKAEKAQFNESLTALMNTFNKQISTIAESIKDSKNENASAPTVEEISE